MGATNEIKGTNITLKLPDLTCPHCSQKFTEQEIDDRNFDIWFDTSNDVRLKPMEELIGDIYYKPFGRTGYQLTIWIRSIEHENCPETETCKQCWDKFLEKEMEQYNGEYYCSPCYQLIDKVHE